jgi:uncharacterized protein YecT (DUF1311 family)
VKYLACIAAVGFMVWSRVPAAEFAEPTCATPGADQLARCLNNASENEDKHLNSIYSLIIKMLDAGAVDPMTAFFYDKKKDLVAAERAWVKFRDAQCAAEATMLGPASASGTVQVTYNCFSRLTQERIEYLKDVASSAKPQSKLCENQADSCQIK